MYGWYAESTEDERKKEKMTMTISQGVFSWEDVLAQRYLNNHHNNQPHPPTHIPTHNDQPQSQSHSQQYAFQFRPQSPLLANIPPELRLLIWEHALGGHCIHIVQWPDRRMGYVVCTDPDLDPGNKDKKCEVCQTGVPSRASPLAKKKREEGCRGLLALGLVCRQIYTESQSLLYTKNTLLIPSTWSLPYLLFPPPSPSPSPPWTPYPLTTLTLHYSFPTHHLPTKTPPKHLYFTAGRAQWLTTCAAVCSLRSLESFTLILDGEWFAESVRRIPGFLEPLRGICINTKNRWKRTGEEGEKEWEVVLPRRADYVDEVGWLNWEVRRRGVRCLVRV